MECIFHIYIQRRNNTQLVLNTHTKNANINIQSQMKSRKKETLTEHTQRCKNKSDRIILTFITQKQIFDFCNCIKRNENKSFIQMNHFRKMNQ